MAVSKAQQTRVTVICACGCGEEFSAFPVYRSKADGGGLRVPEFKRGHHPSCRATQTGQKPAWNAGKKKGDHPSLERMGFQPGHPAFHDWAAVNARLREDPELRARWLQSKKGQTAWNAGLTRDQYPNGIASGPDHGNWLGGDGGVRNTAAFATFRRMILKRDRWTCQLCGDRNHAGRGSRIVLHVDHIEPIVFAPERALDPTNARTLCFECHKGTETYGPKVRRYLKKRRGAEKGGSVSEPSCRPRKS